MFGLMQDWPLRLHRILDHAAAQFPDEVVISRLDDGSCSRTAYARLRSRARRVARRLLQDGICPGDRVGTMAWNGAAHMEAWFGITGCGAVYHTINPRLFVEQILWIIGHAADRALFVEVMFLPLLERLVDRLPSLERVIPSSGFASFRHVGLYVYTREALLRFRSLPPSPMERAEVLEQLRALENGIPIGIARFDFTSIGVDTPEDLVKVRKILERSHHG